MSKRKIINIDEEKCNGCGKCIPDCPEGALKLIDGKARLISDLFCDGLGACIGSCPQDAIRIEEREAESYSEKKVMENIIRQGKGVIKEHLKHLKEHGEEGYLKEALDCLKEKKIPVPAEMMEQKVPAEFKGCPGMKVMSFGEEEKEEVLSAGVKTALRQWPIQLHLVSPLAPYFKGKDVLLSADCVAYSLGDFHSSYLKGKSLAIACPKLDSNKDVYVNKITALVDEANIKTLTVMIMEVPCCMGLWEIAKQGLKKAKRKIPLKKIVIGIKGNVISED